jgi:hypothetical protein
MTHRLRFHYDDRDFDEVLTKEPPIDYESYDVPELDLYGVPLSRILEEIHNRYVVISEGISTAEKAFF